MARTHPATELGPRVAGPRSRSDCRSQFGGCFEARLGWVPAGDQGLGDGLGLGDFGESQDFYIDQV